MDKNSLESKVFEIIKKAVKNPSKYIYDYEFFDDHTARIKRGVKINIYNTTRESGAMINVTRNDLYYTINLYEIKQGHVTNYIKIKKIKNNDKTELDLIKLLDVLINKIPDYCEEKKETDRIKHFYNLLTNKG